MVWQTFLVVLPSQLNFAGGTFLDTARADPKSNQVKNEGSPALSLKEVPTMFANLAQLRRLPWPSWLRVLGGCFVSLIYFSLSHERNLKTWVLPVGQLDWILRGLCIRSNFISGCLCVHKGFCFVFLRWVFKSVGR